MDKALYGIGPLEETPLTTWYRHEEKSGRLDMAWDTFKAFLLNDLFPPEIRFRNVHVLTGLLVGRFTCQASKPANAQTRLADTVDALASEPE